jgi:8-oxo-dGTP pyrophosphatase MutT (NUDIX family)
MEAQNPWQTLSSRLIYENAWIAVTEHQVIRPDGLPGMYGTVHFQSDAVGVVPYEDGWIWLVGQWRYPLDRYEWEIPEGGSPPGEDPETTARRELREETGLEAGQLRPILEMNLSNSVSDEWGIVYLATGLRQLEAEPEGTEVLSIRKIRLEDAYREVEARQIRDSLSVAAIYKLMLMRAAGEL